MRTLVVAPHPDDEVLGCGGTLLRRKASGAATAWLIVTGVSEADGWPAERVTSRALEIERVGALMQFDRVYNLALPTGTLDRLPRAELVGRFGAAFREFEPSEVFVPHRGDAHSDHAVCFDAAVACTKSFRYPFVRRVLAYETVSETDFGLDPASPFSPNVFVDVTDHLERKIEALQIYASELKGFPFPRSVEAVRALAAVRGATAACMAAEAFQLLRQIERG